MTGYAMLLFEMNNISWLFLINNINIRYYFQTEYFFLSLAQLIVYKESCGCVFGFSCGGGGQSWEKAKNPIILIMVPHFFFLTLNHWASENPWPWNLKTADIYFSDPANNFDGDRSGYIVNIEFLLLKSIELFSFHQNLSTFLTDISLLSYWKGVEKKLLEVRIIWSTPDIRLSGKWNRISGRIQYLKKAGP